MGETLFFALLIGAFGSMFFQIGRGRKGRAREHSQPVPPGPARAKPAPIESTRVEPSFRSKGVHPDALRAEPPDPIRVERNSDAEEMAIEQAPSPPHPMASATTVKFLIRRGTDCTVGFTDAAGHDLVTRTSTIPTGLGVMEGEYLRLMIDMESGRVLNWQRPSEEALRRFYDWQTA